MNFTYMLAPIEDMTGGAFRTICHKYGADLTFTELARVEGLARNNKSTWSRMDFKDNTPVVVQLLGAKEEYFAKFLDIFKPKQGFKGINLNFGCPSPQVINLGQGCAMVRRINKAKKIVEMIKNKGYDVSIKMRLGLNRIDKEHKSYLNMIKDVDADYFVVHARYGSQTYAEPADFSVYADCVKTGKNIIANGDIKTKEHVDYLKSVGVKGVMIGRSAISDPSIFNKLKGISSPSLEQITNEFVSLTEKYDEPFRYRKNVLKRLGKSGLNDVNERTEN